MDVDYLYDGGTFFSDDVFDLARALFGNFNLSGISSSTAILLMFVCNSIALSYLAFKTGGTRNSPFAPILFSLPALSIFLHESFSRVLVYLILVIIGLSVCLNAPPTSIWHEPTFTGKRENADTRIVRAYFLSVILCLVLTTFVAFMTRSL